MKKQNKIRLIMAAILCAGLLIVGIGFGIGFGELSHFTYAGSKLLSNSTVKNFSSDVELFHTDGKIYISTYAFGDQLKAQDCLVVSGDVEPGIIHVDANYRSVSSVPEVFHHLSGSLDTEEAETLYFNWSGSPASLFFAYKDEVMADLKNHQLGDYRECEISDLVITVNPADKDRIIFE